MDNAAPNLPSVSPSTLEVAAVAIAPSVAPTTAPAMFVAPEVGDMQAQLAEAQKETSADVLKQKLDATQAKLSAAMKSAEASYNAVEKNASNTALYQSFAKQMEAYHMVLDTMSKSAPGKLASIGQQIKTGSQEIFAKYAPESLKNLFAKK